MTDRRPDQPDARMFARLLHVAGIDPAVAGGAACSICGTDLNPAYTRGVRSPRIEGAREYLCGGCHAKVIMVYRALPNAAAPEPPCTGAGGHIWRANVKGAPCARIACDVRRGDRA